MLAKGLRYMAPLPLLQTIGANLDYCGADDMVTHLAPISPDIQELVRNKSVSSDKKTHTVFLVLAAPGQGKSRCLQELPAFINATQAIGQRRMLSFLLTLENGQSPDTSLKTSPECIVASASTMWGAGLLRMVCGAGAGWDAEFARL